MTISPGAGRVRGDRRGVGERGPEQRSSARLFRKNIEVINASGRIPSLARYSFVFEYNGHHVF